MKRTIEIKTIGQLLAYTMWDRNDTNRQVGEQTGIPHTVIWRMAQGRDFRIQWLKKVAEYCGISPEEAWNLLPSPTKEASDEG